MTPRRWVAHANPGLTALISEKIGDQWIADLANLDQLKPFAGPGNEPFQHAWHAVKLANKRRLAALVKAECDVVFEPTALFDVQVKRIHEYKRQLLNILHVIHLYIRIKTYFNFINRPRRFFHFTHHHINCIYANGKIS